MYMLEMFTNFISSWHLLHWIPHFTYFFTTYISSPCQLDFYLDIKADIFLLVFLIKRLASWPLRLWDTIRMRYDIGYFRLLAAPPHKPVQWQWSLTFLSSGWLNSLKKLTFFCYFMLFVQHISSAIGSCGNVAYNCFTSLSKFPKNFSTQSLPQYIFIGSTTSPYICKRAV